jgi:hypothetical protein
MSSIEGAINIIVEMSASKLIGNPPVSYDEKREEDTSCLYLFDRDAYLPIRLIRRV